MAAYCAQFIGGIDANRTLKDELASAVARRSARRRISVTDLINPRQAYFQRVRPDIKLSPDRLQAMMAGTGFHELFGRAISTEEFVEQFVEFEDIVGKIDVFEDAPVELKTTGSIPADVLIDRASHVEQLVMYCRMVRKSSGHLLYYKRADFGRPPLLRAFDVDLKDSGPILSEMIRRRDLLRAALDTGDFALLPRCEWFGRECMFEEICLCDTASPGVRMVSRATVEVRDNPDLAQRLQDKIAYPEEEKPRQGISLNDLVFPRKAAYRLKDGGVEEVDAESRMASFERQGFEGALMDAMWYGFPGACRRTRISFGPVRASVMLLRDVPTLFRNNKRREMIDRNRLALEVPHYIERLGFECGLTNTEKGRLIIYYSAVPSEKFMVYDIWFKDLASIRTEMQRRLELLEAAGVDPEKLPPCQPEWMSKYCQFAPGCGCGSNPEPEGKV